jgi:hypothetical protein
MVCALAMVAPRATATQNVRIARAAATVGLQNKVFIVFLLEDHFFWGLKASVVPFGGQIAANRQAWQWSDADDSLTSSCLWKPLKQIEMSLPNGVPVECFLFA